MKEIYNPYFKMCHGEKITASQIKQSIPFVIPDIDSLVKQGDVIGQGTLDGDIEYWMPNKLGKK